MTGTFMYYVKNALSNGGIRKFKPTEDAKGVPDGCVRMDRRFTFETPKVGTDCFQDINEAIAAVEKKRQKRLQSLRKEILKLEKMDLTAPPQPMLPKDE